MNGSEGVPGWVLITVMTAGLVVGIAAVVGPSEVTSLLDPLFNP